jgi:hypothetical protein
MKNYSLNLSAKCTIKNVYATGLLQHLIKKSGVVFCLIVLLGAFLFSGCKKNGNNECKGLNDDKEFKSSCQGLSQQTLCELRQARKQQRNTATLTKLLQTAMQI